MNLHAQDRTSRETAETRARVPPPQASPTARPVDQDEISFADLVHAAWAGKWSVLAVAAILVAAASLYIILETRLYTATASLVLKADQQNLMNFEGLMPGLSSETEAMNTELLVLRSRSLLGHVVDEMSLQEDPEFNPRLRPVPGWKEWTGYHRLLDILGLAAAPDRPPEKIREIAIEILREHKLSVVIVPKTFAVDIAVESQDREKSAKIANTIAERYLEAQREAKFTAMDDAMVWLARRVAELKEELETAEEKVRDYAADAAVTTEERLFLNTEKLKRMRDELASQRTAAEDLRARIANLESLYVQGDFETLGEIAEVPQLQALARSLTGAAADSATRSRFEAAFERWLEQLRADVRRTERQIDSLVRGVDAVEADLRSQSVDFVRFQQLQREAEATRLIYEHSLARMKEISIQQGIQQADARVLDPAKIPDEPSHPKTIQTLLASGVFGSLLGLLVVFMRNALRTTLQSPEELEDLTGLPAIGIIPDGRARRPGALLAQIVEKPAAPFAEALRNLRTAIHLSDLDAPPQVVLVTSSVPGEGKSTVAAGLALVAAMSGNKVLLIDGDLRRRTLKEYFGIAGNLGILAVLAGKAPIEQAILHHDTTQLDILIADEGNVAAGEIFESRRFFDFIKDLRKKYDIIVMDSPPILAVSDTRVIAQQMDSVVYVVRWNSTPRRVLRAGLDRLRQVNIGVTGMVLNRVKTHRSEGYGYYGYGDE